jgi:hypothetical protein
MGLVAAAGRQEPATLFAALVGRGLPLGRFQRLRAALRRDGGSQVGELLCWRARS